MVTPFDLVGQLQALREQLGSGPGASTLQAYSQARTGNFGELSAPVAGAPAISGDLSPAERWIIQRESSGRTTAKNPKSTAFGLGQLLEANRKRYLGADYATTDYAKQLQAFRSYVRDRYGSAEKAQAFWQANGWY